MESPECRQGQLKVCSSPAPAVFITHPDIPTASPSVSRFELSEHFSLQLEVYSIFLQDKHDKYYYLLLRVREWRKVRILIQGHPEVVSQRSSSPEWAGSPDLECFVLPASWPLSTIIHYFSRKYASILRSGACGQGSDLGLF